MGTSAEEVWTIIMHLLTGILQHSKNNPQRVAMIEGKRSIRYAQLHHCIQSLASSLNSGDSERPVAILLDRGIDAAIAIFASLHAGRCYVPLDIRNPPARLQGIIDDAQPGWVIGATSRPDWLNPGIGWLNSQQSIQTSQAEGFSLPDAQALAAILYTSGSTGTPKGVALSHQALLNFARWAQVTFELCSEDQIASLAPFSFDLSIFDLFTSTLSGACVHFVPARLTLSPSRLSQWLQQQQISIWYTVPSILHFLALKGQLTQTPLTHLSRLLFAGEVFPTAGLISLQQQLPDTRLFNLYGPTETNVCCYWAVEPTQLQTDQTIPIGKPACGAELRVDADHHQLQVNSRSNFSGYWHHGQLAKDNVPGEWVNTGDQVSVNPTGEYLYHGRMDRMLKCSGYRVEPAEIEAIIHQVPGVINCAVIGLPDPSSGQRPAAAVVLHTKGDLAHVQLAIRQQLPAYMQPGRLICCDQLPSLSNGKLDYPTLVTLFKQTS